MRRALISAGAVVVLVLVGMMVLSAGDKIESAVIKVDGMRCGDCASTIEGALGEIDGVKSAKASFEEKNVSVTYAISKTDVPSLEKVIAKLGYDAGSTKAEAAHSEGAEHDAQCEDKGTGGCCEEKSSQPST
jgi:copper chaperone CopZ